MEREAVREAVIRHAKALLTAERVQAVIDAVRRREEADGLESIASLPDVSFDVLAASGAPVLPAPPRRRPAWRPRRRRSFASR